MVVSLRLLIKDRGTINMDDINAHLMIDDNEEYDLSQLDENERYALEQILTYRTIQEDGGKDD
jgi:hypothetical protein